MKRHILISISLWFCIQTIYAQTYSIILGRPTDKSITLSILFDQNVNFYIEYGTSPSIYTKNTSTFSNIANIPNRIEISDLTFNTKFYYDL